MQQKSGIIYKVTNLINGKIYVGKTIKSLRDRKLRHFAELKIKSNYIFYRAISKYGKENFKWEVVDQCLFHDLLLELEKFYIKKFNSKKPHGYNMTEGGKGVIGREVSKETRKKIGNANRIRMNERLSNGWRVPAKKISDGLQKKLATGWRPTPLGTHHSEETKNKIRIKLYERLAKRQIEEG